MNQDIFGSEVSWWGTAEIGPAVEPGRFAVSRRGCSSAVRMKTAFSASSVKVEICSLQQQAGFPSATTR